ncbi:MAG: phosphoribosylformylglycinamidine synthase subunit PurL [Pirellulaceae bacterium]
MEARQYDNMLKETIFAATQSIRRELSDDDWCVSVFKDNAGIVKFNDDHNITFKVETHNRPSAIEPYGGANTGLGGVIRDTMGTGMGAKPVCSTDVFCFASPDRSYESLPPGVLHPQRIIKGVVAGVRDYGNRMGIPTVNGAVYFDDRYIGNPMVFCGNVGLIPTDKSFKEPQPNDLIVVLGGRTGRDGIHGATFSSVELTDKSEKVSSGAVQIGNAIVEKMVLDVMLQARDQGLYNAVTDCGAGGFSSAVGEMGEDIGAEVWLEQAPLKYSGLSYTEIWISEAQERMVFAVPEEKWPELKHLADSESVEATVIGRFTPTGNLTLKFDGTEVGCLPMEFLHGGRPPVIRNAKYRPAQPVELTESDLKRIDPHETLHAILSAPNVASKQWIIRQYDHEVLAGSVIKPLVGVKNDGPSDAAVVQPLLDCARGITISCGMNPLYGDFDTYHMAASSIDEAVRNCVAVGADPTRIGILDNFCWGYTDRPETLGSLVRAAIACQEVAKEFKTPFISGKDSLNNEFSFNENGERKTISIPSTLLISALGQTPDVTQCVTMDMKKAGNLIYLVGVTRCEMGGSHALLVNQLHGKGNVPQVDTQRSVQIFNAIYSGISQRLVRSCHDLSEGGLATAIAEMCFAGGLGATIDVASIPVLSEENLINVIRLFSESNSRFLVEVQPENKADFEALLPPALLSQIGTVCESRTLTVLSGGETLLTESIDGLKQSWQKTFDWK